jgi:GTP diphosphokinase / guanosine-3',5'-bis(diphosphate) 3'-diphosphatase
MLRTFYKDIKLPETFNKDLVERAFKYAQKAHKGQKRKSGDDYIIHPVAVARILLELNMSDSMVAAAMLHDTIEDTETTISDIQSEFGDDVAQLVVGVTKLGQVDFSTYSGEDAEEAKTHLRNENLRQLFLAMAEDGRVVIIKLADRLHNMRTIKALPKEDQMRIARETLNIFSPLALRLGMGEIKGELEDLSFPVAYPEEFKKIKSEANRRYKAADRYTLHVKRQIADKLDLNNIDAQISGRAKHLYSLYKKITRPEINWDFDKVYDLVALRILTDSVEDCYRILGLIHSMYRPLPNYIRDYIAAPKPNGYRSIHTSVFGPEGKIVEIQVRTHEMHEEAEFGIASHLHYTMAKSSGASDEKLSKGTFAKKEQTDFLKQIKTMQQEGVNAEEFIESLKLDFLDERIYVFSPKGDIYDLPACATPIDFAYEVHSNLGDTITGAKVNGRMVQLDTQLVTRDVVEVITNKKSAPKRDWLDFVKSSKAKQHIRGYFRNFEQEKHQEAGQRIVAESLHDLGFDINDLSEAQIKDALSETSFKSIEALYSSVGAGITTPRQAIKMILRRSFIPEEQKKIEKKAEVAKSDFKGMKITMATCCNPTKDDKVACYVTRGKGLTVHLRDCPNLKSLEPERTFLYNPWKQEFLPVKLEIIGRDRVGMIRDVTGAISDLHINIEKMANHHLGGETIFDLVVSVGDFSQASELIKKLKSVKDVTSVKRIA